MKKPWSISTTVRNPDRIKGFLEVLAGFEGKTFNEEQQINYQIKLIQKKLYKPTHMSSKLGKYYDSPSDMKLRQATEIFRHMEKQSTVLGEDPGFRGRTSAAPLGKMGLAIIKTSAGKITITNFGKKFLHDEIDIGEVFLRYFFKWSLWNPDTDEFTENDGFDIRPFFATLRIIREVNRKSKSMGWNPVGLSKKEFYIFVPTTINYKDIPKTVNEIIQVRKNLKGKSATAQKRILNKCLENKAKVFFEDTKRDRVKKNISTLKDYGDNIIRYFKLTRFLQIRGNGFYVDLEPRRTIEIKALLGYSDGRRLELNDMESYRRFIDSEVDYPWETPEKLKAIASSLIKDTVRLDRSLDKPLGISKKLININVNKMDKNSLKVLIEQLRSKRKEVQEQAIHLDLINPDRLKEVIDSLSKIYEKEDRPIELEYLVAMCLHAINDALKIQPNYPVGDDNKPTFTAPANVPDIECFYTSFGLICEVTMLKSRDQWFQEGQPVMRHLRDFELNKERNSICLFIAPNIHRDTFNTFNFANKYEYEGAKQKIIPLTINQFLKLLEKVLAKKRDNDPITHEEFGNLLGKLYSSIIGSKTIEEWERNSNKILNNYISN